MKGILLGYDAQLKEIATNVANMTQEALIRATNANYEKMMQEAIQEMLKTGIDEATQKDRIEQIKQATQLNYIEMSAKRAEALTSALIKCIKIQYLQQQHWK